MNRHDDIRNLMNLMESVPAVTLTEADTSVVDSFTDLVIDTFKAKMDERPDWATSFIDNGSEDAVYDLIEKQPGEDFYDKLVASGWPKPAKEFKYLNAKFKEKYGVGFFKYAEQLEDKSHDDDKKSIKPEDKKIFKLMSDKMTVSVTPKWAAENLEFYVMSKAKLAVQDTNRSFPTIVIGKPSLEYLKMDQQQMIDWMISKGFSQRKRPTYKKSPPPFYD